MPLFDYLCDECGWEYPDQYVPTSALNEVPLCTATIGDGDDTLVPGQECGHLLTRLIGAPFAPHMKVGEHASEASKLENAHETRKKLMKRSHDHEFKKGGKGVEERRATLERLEKAGVPVVGKRGF